MVLSYRKIIRKYIRTIRRTLTWKEQYIAAQLITNRVMAVNYIHQLKHIALYMPFDGEMNTIPLIHRLLFMNKKVYLPILPHCGSHYLFFAEYTLSTTLICNRFNIYEPQWNKHSIISIKTLDIIFVPLVAFNENGVRLGMGGGFYDQTLRSYNNQTNYILIGLGYDFQKIPNTLFPGESWDITLPEVITPHYHWYNNIVSK